MLRTRRVSVTAVFVCFIIAQYLDAFTLLAGPRWILNRHVSVFVGRSSVFMVSDPTPGIPNFAKEDPLESLSNPSKQVVFTPDRVGATSSLLEPTFHDMKELAYILANITEHLDTNPEKAMSVVSQRMGWLYNHNIPKLTNMMLQEFPSVRKETGMMRAYIFLMDFLEAVVSETSALQQTNQKALRKLLEAAKVSEVAVDEAIAENKEQLLKPEFLLYIDSEIENQDIDSPLENLLVTIKLRLLDEIGRGLGLDVMMLPRLAAEEDPIELRRKTTEYLQSYDRTCQELFLQSLKLMRVEMKKRYSQLRVDTTLLEHLDIIEEVAEELLLEDEDGDGDVRENEKGRFVRGVCWKGE
jgi:hypothetical protein